MSVLQGAPSKLCLGGDFCLSPPSTDENQKSRPSGAWTGPPQVQLHCRGRVRQRQCNFENCSTAGPGAGLNLSAVFPQDRLANTEPETRASSRPPGGVEGIENIGQHFGANAGPIILKDHRQRLAGVFQTDPQSTKLAGLSHRLFSIQNEIEENLHELMRIAIDHG